MMKKNVLFFLFLYSCSLFSQSIQPKVDERVEMMSLVFRLADAEEYNRKNNEVYVQNITEYFKGYKKHPIILFIKKNRNTYGLGYDAVMSMAMHLEFKNNQFSFIQEKENTLDNRWNKVNLPLFLEKLNDFNRVTRFKRFFRKHECQYRNAEQSYQKNILKDFNPKWYSEFYGSKPNEIFKVLLGYGNGSGNYGIKVKPTRQKEIVNAIVGVYEFNDEGKAVFDKNRFQPTLIHEFNHSFVNYLLEMDNNKSQLKDAASKLYSHVGKEMNEQAYGSWETMINESIVRASVVRYMMDNNYSKGEIEEEIIVQINRKFLWTKDLVDLLGEYDENRTIYPNLRSFYPKIITFFKQYSERIEEHIADFKKLQPKVVSISPNIINHENVEIDTKEIVVYFDQKMNAEHRSFSYGELGKSHFPLKKFGGFINSQSMKIYLKKLEPNKTYQFKITGNGFQSKKGYPLQTQTVEFKTK